MMKLHYFLLISLFLVSCTTGYIVQTPLLKETSEEPSIYFCPQDPCETLFANYINNSKESVHCALFDLDLEEVLICIIISARVAEGA